MSPELVKAGWLCVGMLLGFASRSTVLFLLGREKPPILMGEVYVSPSGRRVEVRYNLWGPLGGSVGVRAVDDPNATTNDVSRPAFRRHYRLEVTAAWERVLSDTAGGAP